jgi:Flp pilus assembly protein TadG
MSTPFGVHSELNRSGFRRLQSTRRAVAAAETALTLPLLITLVFGSIEIANGVFLRQSLTVAAYEGARAVSRSGATNADGQARVQEALAARGITDYTVSFSPTVTESTPRSTELTITVTAPASAYSFGLVRFFQGKQLGREFRMVRL